MSAVKQSLLVSLFFVFLVCNCAGKEMPAQAVPENTEPLPVQRQNQQNAAFIKEKVSRVLTVSQIPAELKKKIEESAGAPGTSAFLSQLDRILKDDDIYLRRLVDKKHALNADYEPHDLVDLQYKSYRAGISDPMLLRRKAEEALENMAVAAKAAGLTLVVSSAYRSYEYQIGSFDRWTARLGLKEAERVSARAGHSQHQLGLVVDFGSINNNFADSVMGKWIAANAARFGFSLSYPQGYEDITGYAWESWHFRFVGEELADFINTWFDGVQQYALSFIFEWEQDELFLNLR